VKIDANLFQHSGKHPDRTDPIYRGGLGAGQVGQNPQTIGVSCRRDPNIQQHPNFALKSIKPKKLGMFTS
jgi:hypothetical protein